MSAERMVSVTIDGQELSVPAGTLVIRAAESIGRYVPRFCDHPLLDPLGACRQCLVEVEGQRKPLTACTTPVADGMVVKTQFTSELAADAQAGVLELLLINHPLDCPMCDKGGECPLQDQALAYGPGGSRYVDPKRRYVKPIPISPLIKLDRERCVLCARCTRFADQIAGDPFIELFERGALEQVAIFEDEPYDSVFSGNVVQICPVGALTASTFRFRARPFDMTTTPSTCDLCASGCSIDVQERRGELVRVLARENLAVNDEWICDKGRFEFTYAQRPDRVTEPLVRKGDEFVAVGWAEAIAVVAERVAAAREGGGGAAVLGGERLCDEDSYALSRFARAVLRTNDVDARMRAGGAERAFARTGGDEEAEVLAALAGSITATNADVDAARATLVVGLDPHEESPIVLLRLRKNARRGMAIHEVAPERTDLRKSGARWTPCPPGGEAAVLLALAAALEARGDSGLDPWTRAANAGPGAEALRAQVDAEAIERLAAALSEARGSVVVLAGERCAASPGALSLAWNIASALGGRFGWVPRKAGARGAVWAGLRPALLPGGRRVDDEVARAEVEAVWGAPVPATSGRDARAILEAAAGGLDLLYLAGADPVTDFPDGSLGARAVENAGFVVAHDFFLTESTRRADVVLPAATAYERAGTLTNWEGRAQPVAAAVAPPGLAQADFEILARVAAEAVDADVPFPATLDALRDEMRALAREPEVARPVHVSPLEPAPTRGSTPLQGSTPDSGPASESGPISAPGAE